MLSIPRPVMVHSEHIPERHRNPACAASRLVSMFDAFGNRFHAEACGQSVRWRARFRRGLRCYRCRSRRTCRSSAGRRASADVAEVGVSGSRSRRWRRALPSHATGSSFPQWRRCGRRRPIRSDPISSRVGDLVISQALFNKSKNPGVAIGLRKR